MQNYDALLQEPVSTHNYGFNLQADALAIVPQTQQREASRQANAASRVSAGSNVRTVDMAQLQGDHHHWINSQLHSGEDRPNSMLHTPPRASVQASSPVNPFTNPTPAHIPSHSAQPHTNESFMRDFPRESERTRIAKEEVQVLRATNARYLSDMQQMREQLAALSQQVEQSNQLARQREAQIAQVYQQKLEHVVSETESAYSNRIHDMQDHINRLSRNPQPVPTMSAPVSTIRTFPQPSTPVSILRPTETYVPYPTIPRGQGTTRPADEVRASNLGGGNGMITAAQSKVIESINTKVLKDIPLFKVDADVVDWAHTVRTHLEIVQNSPAEARSAVIRAMSTNASAWLASIQCLSKSAAEILDEAVRFFGGRVAEIKSRREFDTMTRDPTQTLAQWGQLVAQAFLRHEPSAPEVSRVNKFVNGLSGRLQAAVISADVQPQTLAEAIDIASRKEFGFQLEVDNFKTKPLKQVNVVTPTEERAAGWQHEVTDSLKELSKDIQDVLAIRSGRERSNHCYNCNETTHFAKDCPHPDKRDKSKKETGKFCDHHHSSTHSNEECKAQQRGRDNKSYHNPTPQTTNPESEKKP